jgi:hypothetical protein
MTNPGAMIERFPELKKSEDLSKEYFMYLINTGIARFDFRNIIRKLPVDAIDVAIIGSRRWYICTRGIICFADNLCDFVGRTALSYFSHPFYTSESTGMKLYFLPWDKIKQYREPRLWFLNRRTKPSIKQALIWLKKDTVKARAYWGNPLYSPLDHSQEARFNQCVDGIFVDQSGIMFLMKINQSHHYYFVEWLSVRDWKLLHGIDSSK